MAEEEQKETRVEDLKAALVAAKDLIDSLRDYNKRLGVFLFSFFFFSSPLVCITSWNP
jgi:hypothetical protein